MKITRLLVVSFILTGLCAGCATMDFFEFLTPESGPGDKYIYNSYEGTELKKSSSADVLMRIHSAEHELLSQSTSVIASQGSSKKGQKQWFNMVSFDENLIKAQRKYVMVVDEKPKFLGVEPWAGFAFDGQVVLSEVILNEPYSNDNARRIAILRNILENFRSDAREVSSDNKSIKACAAMINQAFEAVLVKLDADIATPAEAVRLSDPKGLEFSHISLDKARIRLIIRDDIAKVKIRAGSLVKPRLGLPIDNFEDE